MAGILFRLKADLVAVEVALALMVLALLAHLV
jgi:hypothetical protein